MSSELVAIYAFFACAVIGFATIVAMFFQLFRELWRIASGYYTK